MRTYKGLLSDHIKRYGRLTRIAQKTGRWHYEREPILIFMKIISDQSIALQENSELFQYQLKRAYPTI